MADVFSLIGSYQAVPASGVPSGDPTVLAPITESMVIKRKSVVTLELETDSAESVPLGDLAGAHVVIVRAQGAKVRVRLTSTDGSQQAIPADPLAVIVSGTVPFTAIDLTRVAGSGYTVPVKVFLGEKA